MARSLPSTQKASGAYVARVAMLLLLLTAAKNVGLCQQKAASSAPLKNTGGAPFDVRQAFRAVVSIYPVDKAGKPIAQGTGFFVTADGRLVTNYHVIEKAAGAVVKSHDGGFYPVKGILSVDEKNDLALLKVEGHDLPALSLADSDRVSRGDKVFAIGNPLGLEATLSEGIISAVREMEDERVIQTTAPISSGSSGGALLNAQGQVVGVTTFQLKEGQNLNFAIPSNYLKLLLVAKVVTPFDSIEPGAAPAQQETPRETKPAQDSIPFASNWTNVRDGSPMSVRMDGDRAYAQGTAVGDGDYILSEEFNCELQKQGAEWSGKCWHRNHMGAKATVYWNAPETCFLELRVKVTSLTPQRIDGQEQQPVLGTAQHPCPTVGSGWFDFAYIPQK